MGQADACQSQECLLDDPGDAFNLEADAWSDPEHGQHGGPDRAIAARRLHRYQGRHDRAYKIDGARLRAFRYSSERDLSGGSLDSGSRALVRRTTGPGNYSQIPG